LAAVFFTVDPKRLMVGFRAGFRSCFLSVYYLLC